MIWLAPLVAAVVLGAGIGRLVLGHRHRSRVIERDLEHYRHVRMVRVPVDWQEQGWFS